MSSTIAYSREYYQKTREQRLIYAKQYRVNNPDQVKERRRKQTTRIKLEILKKYGGACACCGEQKHEFLCIDHINGGGTEQRKKEKLKPGAQFYYWLRRNNFPPGFRVLCHNCNHAFSAYGVCPHRRAA